MSADRNWIERVLYWSPRLLALALIAFFAVMSFDVLGENEGLWPTLAALFMHLLPALVLAAILWISWRFEWFGAVGFVLLGVAAFIFFQGWRSLPTAILVSFVPLLIGLLFAWHRRVRTP